MRKNLEKREARGESKAIASDYEALR